MEFLLVDVGVTFAFLLGYVAIVVLKRRGALAVMRVRRPTSRAGADLLRSQVLNERTPQADQPRAHARLIQMR